MTDNQRPWTWRWVAHRNDLLSLWRNEEGKPCLRGLLILGDVSAQQLRDIRLLPIRLASPGDQRQARKRGMLLPVWPSTAEDVPAPPPEAEVEKRLARARRIVKVALPDSGQLPTFAPRRSSEDADAFYGRVADAYRQAGGATPILALAAAAGVKRGTASRWVHEARRRGYLPPTTPGRAAR